MNPPRQKTILFLCTGNYYRSRFAENLFNSLASKEGSALDRRVQRAGTGTRDLQRRPDVGIGRAAVAGAGRARRRLRPYAGDGDRRTTSTRPTGSSP